VEVRAKTLRDNNRIGCMIKKKASGAGKGR